MSADESTNNTKFAAAAAIAAIGIGVVMIIVALVLGNLPVASLFAVLVAAGAVLLPEILSRSAK